MDIVAKSKGVVPSARAVEEVDAFPEEDSVGFRARYVISAFNKLEPEQGAFGDAAIVEVFAQSEQEAFRKASRLLRRNWYWVRSVNEVSEEHDHGGR